MRELIFQEKRQSISAATRDDSRGRSSASASRCLRSRTTALFFLGLESCVIQNNPWWCTRETEPNPPTEPQWLLWNSQVPPTSWLAGAGVKSGGRCWEVCVYFESAPDPSGQGWSFQSHRQPLAPSRGGSLQLHAWDCRHKAWRAENTENRPHHRLSPSLPCFPCRGDEGCPGCVTSTATP